MLNNYEVKINDWFEEADLEGNPFTLNIDPSLFVGYEEALKKLSLHIQEGRKFALVSGATGSGKTTLLKLLEKEFSGSHEILYLSKPPEYDEMVDVFTEKVRPSFFQRLFGFNVSVHELSGYLNEKLKETLLLLVDEVHEADVKVLQWLRTITDQVDEIQLILAGLPSIEDKLKGNVETLQSRITTKVELTTLTEEETRDLIERRIERWGGEDLGPFTEGCVKQIYDRTGGFPREVLKVCDKLINRAIEKDEKKIDEVGGLEGEDKGERDKRRGKDLLKELPYKQREIVKILSEEDELFPSEIAEKLGTDSYKTKQHAVRSVNNILRRLLKEDILKREKKGKGYIYSLDIKTKNLLVDT
ncbi:MAG: AAA family ATPase [Candidatus Aenigmatarchaeota archaeon]